MLRERRKAGVEEEWELEKTWGKTVGKL